MFIHPTAEVEQGAIVGEGTRIWRHCHVMAGAVVGERCVLGQGCFVAARVRIGSGCRIQNHVSLYEGLVLGSDVFVGPCAVFTNVSRPRVRFPRNRSQYEQTVVHDGATIGANCTIVCGTTIGEFAFVGAGAVINKDVKPYALMVGVPARQVGWMSEYGEQIPLPVKGKGEYTCPHTGQQYRLNDQTLERISK